MLPIIFNSSFFTLYTYPLFMGLSWGFGYFYTFDYLKKNNIETNQLRNLFIGLFLSSWIGAKLFFLLFSSGPKIYQYIYANYFWLGGGFVFYGGLIFGLIYFFIHSHFLKKFKIESSKYLLPGLIFGHSIGRVGCFLTGCCYGAISDTPMAITINGEHRFPVQAYEAISLFFIGMLVLHLIKKGKSNLITISSYLISYSIVRFLLEFLRGDELRGFVFMDFSTSQFVSIIIFCLTILFLIIEKIKHRN